MVSALRHNISFQGTLFTTDLDGTMLIPANEHMKIDVEDRLYSKSSIEKTETAVKNNGINSVLLNTGRNFTELGEVQDILERTTMPVDAISLEDGKRLLKKPAHMSPRQWIKALFNKNINYMAFRDENWTQKNNAPLKAIGEYLTKEKGFIHRNDKGEKMIYSKPIEKGDTGVEKASKDALWIVTLVPPGIDFEVSIRHQGKDDKVDLKAFNKELTKDISKMLKKKGFDIEHPTTKKCLSYANSIGRNDISKGSVADYVRETLGDDTTLEIRAGNADNDASMLKTENPKVQAIQVGNDKTLTEILKGSKNVTQVPTGELGQGIDRAYQKLDITG